ncbi:hypothetical protein [Methylorubrum extorquens]
MASAPHRLRIPYESFGFTPGTLLFESGLPVTWNDIVWAALTIGRPSVHHVFEHGTSSLYEAMFRIGLVRMALEQSGPHATRLRRTRAFKDLDPTEKGAVSYFLGMAFCKVFASARLRTPWLLHLDAFKGRIALSSLGRSRPDLIGQQTTTGNWLVFETKGRAGKPSSADRTKAKAQAQRVTSISGSTPALRVGTFAYFRNDALHFLWIDPPAAGGKGVEIPEIGDAWRYYYEPVRSLWLEQPEATDEAANGLMVSLPEADLEIHIHKLLAPFLRNRDWVRARQVMAESLQLLIEGEYQADGLKIVCGPSWIRRAEEVVPAR